MFRKPTPSWLTVGAEILLQVQEPDRSPYAERAQVVQINRRSVLLDVGGRRIETPIPAR